MQIRVAASALADIAAIRAYLTDANPRAAGTITSRLVEAVGSLASFPNRGRHGAVAGTRELTSVPPYVIVYTVDDAVEIDRIWHAAQDRF